jgi:hypothetical protein
MPGKLHVIVVPKVVINHIVLRNQQFEIALIAPVPLNEVLSIVRSQTDSVTGYVELTQG